MSPDHDPVPEALDLSPAHWAMLQASAISAEVATERGYRTITKKVELKSLGFKDYQCCVPALLVPVLGPSGAISTYQLRRDVPRITKDGKPIKYETPGGSSMHLDVPARTRPVLSDPTVAIYITEGVKKADSGVTAGIHVLALLGVWNWRGTNRQGGKTVLPEFEEIALNGRRVYLVFDSDVMSKPGVHAALTRLKAWLEHRDAKVLVVYLPDGSSGAKVGLDDYLAARGTVEELRGLARPELDPLPAEVTGEPRVGDYYVEEGETWWMQPTQQGPMPVRLANFAASIVGDVSVDDGFEVKREFEIQAILNGVTCVLNVPAQSFQNMNWPVAELGALAIVSPGFTFRDNFRAAIQYLSKDVERKEFYGHSGWRELPEFGWVYLHSGGAIGPVGPLPTIGVRLGGRGCDFLLPDPPTDAELLECIHATLRLSRLGASPYFYVLIATAFRAALGDTDYAVILYGKTGTQKTECAALVQAFFGTGFNARNLPGSWSSTANSLEMMTFIFKDAVQVIDDFVADGNRSDVQKQMQLLMRLLRAQGNRAGRSRLTADARLKEGRPPRGLILSTCEDLPTRTSALARALVLECGPVDLAVLTECQAQRENGIYAKTMSAFLMWAAGQYAALKDSVAARSVELRTELQRDDAHKRTAAMVGSLQAGFESFIDFALEIGAINTEEAELHRSACLDALVQAGSDQVRHQAETDPVNLFLRFLSAAVSTGQAHFESMDGGAPEVAESFGWRPLTAATDGFSAGQLRPQGICAGWVDGGALYVEPDAALKACHTMGSDMEQVTITRSTLAKRLNDRGLLLSKDIERDRLLIRKQVAGSRHYVLHIAVGVLQGLAQPAHSAGNPSDDAEKADLDPDQWASLDSAPAHTSPPTHVETAAEERSGPVGPREQGDPPLGGGDGVLHDDAGTAPVTAEPNSTDRDDPDSDDWGAV